MNHSVFWNNVRFLRFNKTWTSLKFLVLITGHLFLNSYFFFISDLFSSDLSGIHLAFKYQDLLVIAGVLLICSFSYLSIVHLSLKQREKEIFIRKWFGESSGRIFWNLVTEHILVIGLSVIISMVAFDLIIPALKEFTTFQVDIKSLRKLSYLPVLINSIFIFIIIIPSVIIYSNKDKKDVLEKIYL